jgi:chemotaxis protein methyltransferase CheR
MVRFQAGNLYVDSFPDRLKGIHDFDLILCRNVFIYLHADAVVAILRKFAGCLSQGGYLLTAHTELQGVPLQGFTVRVFPGAVVYQYKGESAGERPEMELSLPVAATGVAAHSQPQTRQAVRISSAPVAQSPAMSDLPGSPAKPMEGEPQELTELLTTARSYANQGQYEEAARTARQALEKDATSGSVYFLLAQIAAHQGQVDEAKAMFRKTIYLEPGNVAAYLELASLSEQLDPPRHAVKMRAAALDLLTAMPPGQVVEPYEPMTAGELAVFVKDMLSELDKNLNKM